MITHFVAAVYGMVAECATLLHNKLLQAKLHNRSLLGVSSALGFKLSVSYVFHMLQYS